jgi:hypothetical protein
MKQPTPTAEECALKQLQRLGALMGFDAIARRKDGELFWLIKDQPGAAAVLIDEFVNVLMAIAAVSTEYDGDFDTRVRAKLAEWRKEEAAHASNNQAQQSPSAASSAS